MGLFGAIAGAMFLPAYVLVREGMAPLLEGPQEELNPLGSIWRARRSKEFYESGSSWYPASPVLLSPSRAKLVYAPLFRAFWDGLGGR